MGSPQRHSSSSKVGIDPKKAAAKENRYDIGLQCRSMAEWILCYSEDLVTVKNGGGEEDVTDVVQLSSTPLDLENVLFGSQAVLEGMPLKVDSMSYFLRRAGWSSHDVSEVEDFSFAVTKPRRPAKTLSHDIVQRITKHVYYVAQG